MQSDNSRSTDPVLDASSTHNARLGIVFFLLYLVLYAGFIVIATFKYEWMSRPALGGLNLAIVYGMGLIIAAFVLAVIYMIMCKRPDARR